MAVLLIDTATPVVKIGIAGEGIVVARDEWQADRALSETLAAHIAQLVQRSLQSVSDIRRIRVHAGPGGFTTLRIGVVTANAFGYALGVPVEGVVGSLSSLNELMERPATSATTMSVIPVYDRPPHITPKGG